MDKKINAEAFEAFVVKAFKLTTEELASLYNDAGELADFSLIERKDAERITKLSTDKTNQYNRGLKEGAQKLEKEIKEKYEIDSDLLGIELFDHVIETKVAEIKKAEPGEVLKHPDVIKALNDKDKALKAKDKEWEKKLADKEKEINRSNLFSKVKEKALLEFEKLNPILPENAEKAQALKDILVERLNKFNYQLEGEDLIVLKEDGSPLQDAHGNGITFADHIKGHAEKYFDFKAADDRSSSGNKPPAGGGQGSKKVRTPKDKADYVSMMSDNTLTPQERVAIKNLAVAAKIV